MASAATHPKTTDVAIVGAGPFGLTIAAHLRARGVAFRIFGEPMKFWREMPPRMFLKSFASHTSIEAPEASYTFPQYSKDRGLEEEEPCAIRDFADYGVLMQQRIAPELEPAAVTKVAKGAQGFDIGLSTGETLSARKVVIAVGLKAFARIPSELAAYSPALVSHTCEHSTFDNFAGKTVFVVGAGQSALQAAALLHEAGARVEVFVRKSAIKFSTESQGERNWLERIRRPKSGLGMGIKNWLLSTFPSAVHYSPDAWRVPFVKSYLGPSVAWWLKERVTDKFPIHYNCAIESAQARDGRLAIKVLNEGQSVNELICDHLVAGTGFEVNLDRLAFLEPQLRQSIARVEKAPRLDGLFQSTVPGLFFVGTASAMSFGPLFRFVTGAAYTARVLARHFASLGSRNARLGRSQAPVPANAQRRAEIGTGV